VVVKSVSPKHLRTFWTAGQVRIGLFSDFRRRTDVRGDAEESTRRVVVQPTEPMVCRTDALKDIMASQIRLRNGSFCAAPGAVFDSAVELPDAYIFATAKRHIAKYGLSSYTITNPQQFGWTLFRAIKARDPLVSCWRFRSVFYQDSPVLRTQQDLRSAVTGGHNVNRPRADDYFRKPTTHVSDDEFRFVFLTDAESPTVLILDVPGLRSFCRQ